MNIGDTVNITGWSDQKNGPATLVELEPDVVVAGGILVRYPDGVTEWFPREYVDA